MSRQNRAMELYRFVAAVLILCYHCYWCGFREEGTQFIGFYLCVELFFILSGFLMLKSIRGHVTGQQRKNPAAATWAYIRGRLRRLYPHHVLSWVLVAMILYFLLEEIWLIELLEIGWAELLLVNIFGFVRGEYINIVCWYISALIFASVPIYYLLVKNEDAFIKIIAPILIVMLYGIVFDRNESLAVTIVFTRYAPFLGFYRAVADITVGCVAYRVYEWLEDAKLPGEWLWATVLEGAIMVAGGMWMFSHSGKGDFLLVPLFAPFVISVFRGKSLFTKLFDNPVSGWLGKHSYAYFLNNLAVIYPCMFLFPEMELMTMCLVCAPVCLVFSVITGTVLKKLTG